MEMAKMNTQRFMVTVLVASLAAGCARVAQLGDDEQAFKAADALWTAVCAKQPQLVHDTAARLTQLHADGNLPDEAFAALQEVVSKADAADWLAARTSLKSFWRGQRSRRDR
jgi:uncharacterized membrane protein